MTKMSILTTEAAAVRAESPNGENSWQRELRQAVRDASELCRRLGLPPSLAAEAAGGSGEFPTFVTPAYLRRMRPGDPNDPLLRQVMPAVEETDDVPGFTADPVGDEQATLEPGVLQKYAGRALLVTTGVCAVHCRYCFRRHFPYQEIPHSEKAWDRAWETIAADPSLTEVILSGGDPLMLVDAKLTALASKIAAVPHVKRLRIHTRMPVMIPSRVNDELIAWLTDSSLTPIMVIHANHAQEIDCDVAAATDRLRAAGVTLLNQAVLLRGVNDSFRSQADLSHRLIEIGVVPYYLHQLDRVAGAAHFEVPESVGKQIVNQLREQLPGYMVPRYVQEVPGELSKTAIV